MISIQNVKKICTLQNSFREWNPALKWNGKVRTKIVFIVHQSLSHIHKKYIYKKNENYATTIASSAAPFV